jgi:hypothetical protein
MGRKHANARHRFIPPDADLSIEFNPQPLATECLQRVVSTFDNIDPVEMLYVWFVWGTLGILFLPALVVLQASL